MQSSCCAGAPLLFRTAANDAASCKLDILLQEIRAQSEIGPLCAAIEEALAGGLMAKVLDPAAGGLMAKLLDPAAGADANGPDSEAASRSKVSTAAECPASMELEDAEVSL